MPTEARVVRRVSAAIVFAFGLSTAPVIATAQDGDWIGIWSASPQPDWGNDFFAPVGIPRSLRDQTIRQVARVSLGGDQVRVEFSNEYGDQPMVIGGARVAMAGSDGTIVPGTDRELTFDGKPSATVPPGAPIWSDPVDLEVEALDSLAVSLYLPEVTPTTTWHNDGRQTAYIGAGDQTAEPGIKADLTTNARIFLSGIMADAEPDARAVVLFGDSITDGDKSTPNENNRWPDVLAERVADTGANVSVLNEGISGARVLRDRMGQNALARFERDVLSHPHADTVVVMMGINDIGWPDSILVPEGETAPNAEDIIAGYQQLIDRAHARGFKIIGATLTPFEDTFEGGPLEGYYNPEKEMKRAAVNEWIRNGGEFDAVIDFDALTADPENPKHIKAAFDSGDHLHPNDAGYEAMANSVDLSLLGIETVSQ
jgi:lysophospholipase L1-like esterase